MRTKKDLLVIAYDIKNDRKRRAITKMLERYGHRVNFSVYECMFTEAELRRVKREMLPMLDRKDDSVAFYPICLNCFVKAEQYPAHQSSRRLVSILS